MGATRIVYAVEVACDVPTGAGVNDLEQRELVTSHELMEAATNPIGSYAAAYAMRAPNDPWTARGGELGDLCEVLAEEGMTR